MRNMNKPQRGDTEGVDRPVERAALSGLGCNGADRIGGLRLRLRSGEAFGPLRLRRAACGMAIPMYIGTGVAMIINRN